MCMELTILYCTLKHLLRGWISCYVFFFFFNHTHTKNGGSDDKESACSAGDLSLIPGSGTSPGEGKRTFPWTEEPGGLQSLGSQRVEQLSNCHFLKHNFTCFYFWLCSAVVALRELRSSCVAWASRCGGFSCCGARL